jgi:phenylalanine ammonia-lyase
MTSLTALDLRALQKEFADGLNHIVSEELTVFFGSSMSHSEFNVLASKVRNAMHQTLESTSTMDAPERMHKVAASSSTVLIDFFTGSAPFSATTIASSLSSIPHFRSNVASRATSLLDGLRREYLSGARGAAPASPYLNRTKPVYEFVRISLRIRMHGSENYNRFANGLGVEDVTIGQNVSLIHEVRTI